MDIVNLNNDLGRRAVVEARTLPWLPSPAAGVSRRLLHREGDEVAIATSIVKYEPGSKFERHMHERGEEFFVLDGEFVDEHGRYPAGSYVRNPWGSSHAPFTDIGCTLFVKLRQLQAEDQERLVLDTQAMPWAPGPVAGIELIHLGGFGAERTSLVKWRPGASFPLHRLKGGEEIFLVSGEFQDEHGRYGESSWLRMPADSEHTPSSPQGCVFLLKSGHLGLPSNR